MMNDRDTIDGVIGFLESYGENKRNLEYYQAKLEGVKAITYTAEEKGAPIMKDNMLDLVYRKEKCVARMSEVEQFVDKEFSGLGRLVLYKRYIQCRTLSDVGNEMGYSASGISRIVKKAINSYLEVKVCN